MAMASPRITAAFVGMEVMQAGHISEILAADGHQSGTQRIDSAVAPDMRRAVTGWRASS